VVARFTYGGRAGQSESVEAKKAEGGCASVGAHNLARRSFDLLVSPVAMRSRRSAPGRLPRRP